jgi:predicted  nucleic acid-binding Zn-ribbon protein
VSSVSELYTLQEIDLALAASRAALEEVQARLGESPELAGAREAVVERQEAARVAEHAFKEREFEADELRRKIEPLDQKLYEGKVTNPKELEDLQRDIDSLKRRHSELEDNALAAMDALETAQETLAEARRALEEAAGSDAAEQEELHTREVELTKEIGDLDERRSAQLERVDPSLMGLYQQLASSRQGRAVAKVVGGACQGCRISLPMNLVQRARSSSDVVQCSSCERILYVT